MLLSGVGSALDPTSQSSANQAGLNEDLNAFLNLLVTQLQHQDPLDPMDATEFTSQLVQFASVEQQIYANSNLEELLRLQETSQITSMVDYLGTTVEVLGDRFNLENGSAEFNYALAAKARETTITIKDEDGEVVYTTSGETETGKHNFVWDGKDSDGNDLEDGIYTVTVSATDPDGELIAVAQSVTGRVTGAGADDGKVILMMGDIAFLLDDVISVKETEKPPPQEEEPTQS